MEDKRSLIDGEWLRSSHISAAQCLMKHAFPDQKGLCDPSYLSDKFQWPSSPRKFVQIAHVKNNHWICLSNVLCEDEGVVELFDSMHTSLLVDNTIKQQTSTILHCQSPSFKIRVVNVQQQESADTCGLFAIAMAFDLCKGTDPFLSVYSESQLRTHLYKCFESKTFLQFPAGTLKQRQNRIIEEVEVQVYCVCRNPDVVPHLGDMACCCKCENWFHEKCVDIPRKVFRRPDVIWFCSSCVH